MGIVKSVQYMVQCENYPKECKGFTDFDELTKEQAIAYFKSIGFKLIKGKWLCKNCADKLTFKTS